MRRIVPLVWRVCVYDQVGAGPASLTERREVQAVVMAVQRLIVIKVIQPLLICAEAPITECISPTWRRALSSLKRDSSGGLRKSACSIARLACASPPWMAGPPQLAAILLELLDPYEAGVAHRRADQLADLGDDLLHRERCSLAGRACLKRLDEVISLVAGRHPEGPTPRALRQRRQDDCLERIERIVSAANQAGPLRLAQPTQLP